MFEMSFTDPLIDQLRSMPPDKTFGEASGWSRDLSWAAYNLGHWMGQAILFGSLTKKDTAWYTFMCTTAAKPILMDEVQGLKETVLILAQCLEPRTEDQNEDWDSFEFEDLRCGIIERRHALWGITVAIQQGLNRDKEELTDDLAHEASRSGEILLAELRVALDEIDSLCNEPDRLALLSVVAHLPLLDNYRSWLAEPFRSEKLPWWLDETLPWRAQSTC